jgi:hypothetical protein
VPICVLISLMFSLLFSPPIVIGQQPPVQAPAFSPPSYPFLQQPDYPYQEQYLSPQPEVSTTALANYDNFEGGTYFLNDGQMSPNRKWIDVYGGYGTVKVTTEITMPGTSNNYLFEQPKISTSPQETHASLVSSTKAFSDFQMTLNVKTVMQLRKNSPPNPWETAWIFWHYTDNFHYYALTLKTNGFQIEKKDNNNHDDSAEKYLVTTYSPRVKIGQWQTITIRHEGSSTGMPHIQVWVDGIKAADFIDNQIRNSIKMSSGYVGLYNEDSRVNFDNVNIN